MSLSKTRMLVAVAIAVTTLFTNIKDGLANTEFGNAFSASEKRTITGISGGSVDSQGCGYIPNVPSYEMNLSAKIDYMRLTVEATGGQPTLLVVGPNPGDSFCVLGDEISGLKPEISGVWEPGNYQVYIGNRTNTQHEFVLDISTDN